MIKYLILFIFILSCNLTPNCTNKECVLQLLSKKDSFETEYIGIKAKKSKLYVQGVKLGKYLTEEELFKLLDSDNNNVIKAYSFYILTKKSPLLSKDKFIDDLLFDESNIIYYSNRNIPYEVRMNEFCYAMLRNNIESQLFNDEFILMVKSIINANNIQFDDFTNTL